MLPVPSTIPVTVARASWLPLRTSCLPRSAEMAELIILDGPPMKKPVAARIAALITLSSGEPEGSGGRTINSHPSVEALKKAAANTHGCIPPGRPSPWRGWKPKLELSSPWGQRSDPEGFPLRQTHRYSDSSDVTLGTQMPPPFRSLPTIPPTSYQTDSRSACASFQP